MHPEVRARCRFAKRATAPFSMHSAAGAQNAASARKSRPLRSGRNPCKTARFMEDRLSAQTRYKALPCRRSWVRVPSSALNEALQRRAFPLTALSRRAGSLQVSVRLAQIVLADQTIRDAARATRRDGRPAGRVPRRRRARRRRPPPPPRASDAGGPDTRPAARRALRVPSKPLSSPSGSQPLIAAMADLARSAISCGGTSST